MTNDPVPQTPTVIPADDFTASERSELARVKRLIMDGKAVHPGLPNPPLGICAGGNEAYCESEQLNAVGEWKAAYQGDYGAQRNVAFCLSTGCDGLMPDRVQGCAWRMIIIDAADPEMGEGDVMNMETECRALTEAGRSAAASHAARISETIARGAA